MTADPAQVLLISSVAFGVTALIGPMLFVAIYSRIQEKKEAK